MTGEHPSGAGGTVAVLFHESRTLGAGLSVARVREKLGESGWRLVGWLPEPGPLAAALGASNPNPRSRPIAFSARGWRRPPGLVARLVATPGYLRAVGAWLRELSPRLVHANSLQVLPEATVARMLGIPVVLQLHELPTPGVKLRLTLRWAAAISDVLVGVSDAVSDVLRAHAGRTPVLTVRNGVAPVAGRRNRRTSGFVVGSVGYVSRSKGTDVFLRAAERVLHERPDVRFEHVGAARLWGHDTFDDEVDRLAGAPALRSSLAMLGPASVADALARWSVFVLASRTEAFPLSSLEAMAAGVPVVATSVGGVPEQITHLETGILVSPESPSELAAWIVRLHDDDALRARLAEAGRRRAVRDFTLDAQAKGLAAAYELACSRRRAGFRLRKRLRAAN